MTDRMADDELTALLAEHVISERHAKASSEYWRHICNCGDAWPCTEVRLATEVRDLRAVAKAGAQTDRDHETLFQDLEEEPCRFDHNGFCQAHYWTGSEPNKCGLAEAKERWNAFLAALARYEEGGR